MNRATALVLFDIDGTLIRGAGHHHKEALIEGIRRVTGLATHLDGIATSGMLDRDLIVTMLRAAGFSQTQAQKELRAIMAECQSIYLHNCAADLSSCLCTGVREFVRAVKERGAVLGVVTGNLSQIGWKKIELAGLREYFSVGAFAEEGRTRSRLARVCAQRAKKQRLISSDARITLIGDHPNDIEAARANAFQAVAVATGLTPVEELHRAVPDYLVPSLAALSVEAVL